MERSDTKLLDRYKVEIDSFKQLLELQEQTVFEQATLLEEKVNELNRLVEMLNEEIVERKRMEEALRESEKRFSDIADNAQEWVWEVDAEGKYLYSSPVVEKILGYKPEEMLGKYFYDFFPPEGPEELKKAVLEVFAQKIPFKDFENQNLDKNGKTVYLLTSGVPILDPQGNLLGYRGSIIDITERKRAEENLAQALAELKRSNQELEHFAYIASHDLQEPLRAVGSFVQLLAKRQKGKLDPESDEFVNYAVDGAQRMQVMINDLLAYSRVGTKVNPFELTDLSALMKKVLANLQIIIAESNAQIQVADLPELIADPSQLAGLFQNLIGNSIKFRAKEAPQIQIAAKQQNKEWLFSVKDNCIGIDPKDQERIFQIFQRLHSRSEYPGTGIGLAVCKRIVERHGGRIWVESKPGEGSTFYFTISVKELKQPQPV